MLHKSFELVETKADGESGTFEALVSVFGNVDGVGDRILNGAYTKTLERWRQSGDPIPIILSHQWDNPMSHIGVADPNDVKQTPRGLLVKGQLDIADNDVARQVYRLMKRRSLKEFSIGYTVPEGGEARAEDGANDITEIDLVECGPTLKGANPEAQLQAVKSAIQEAEPEPEPPRDERELRKESDRLERDRIAGTLPEVKADKPLTEAPSEEFKTLKVELAGFTAELQSLKAQLEARTEKQLRHESDRLERERIKAELPEERPEPEPEPEPDEAFKAELAELKTDLQAVRDKLAEQEQQAEQAKEPTRARPADPLRQRSDQTVLEVQSGGASLRKPPQIKQEPTPEPVDEADLRRRSRETMLELLTGASE